MSGQIVLLSLWRGLITLPANRYSTEGLITPDVLADALRQAAERYGVDCAIITQRKRGGRRVAWARQYAMWLLRQHRWGTGEAKFSFPEIGLALGGWDHTTAMHACRRVPKRLQMEAAA